MYFNVNFNNSLDESKKGKNVKKTFKLKTRTQEVKKPERGREYERKYKDLWESAEDILFLTDLEGNIIEVNRTGRELFGYKHKKLNVLDVVDEKYRPLVTREIGKLIRSKTEVSFLELLCYTKEGNQVWIESKAKPIIEKGRVKAIYWIARDITDRKIIEEKLRESEEKFRKIFLSAPNLIAILDENGTFIEANPAMQERLGTNPIGKTLLDLLPEKLAKSRIRRLKRVIKNNEEIIFEDRRDNREYLNKFLPIVLKDKRYCLVLAQDVTDLRRMNKLLMTLNKINRLLVSEKSLKRIFNRTAKLLSELKEYYSVWIGLIEGGSVVKAAYFDGLRVHPEKLELDLPCFQTALKMMKSIKRETNVRKESCPFYEQFKDHSCLILPMVIDKDVLGFIVIHSTYELPGKDEVDLLETLAKDLAFTNKSIELDKAKRKAYRQIEKNIEELAILVDHIRNPLAIISGTAEISFEGEAKENILISVDRINDVIRRLDKRWLESEEIRKFLKRYL